MDHVFVLFSCFILTLGFPLFHLFRRCSLSLLWAPRRTCARSLIRTCINWMARQFQIIALPSQVLATSIACQSQAYIFAQELSAELYLPSALTHLSIMLFEGAMGNPVPTCALQMMAFESTHRNMECVAGSTNSALYVRKGANSWTRFIVTL